MPAYDYRLVPVPTRSNRKNGGRDPAERFARTLEEEMNRLGAEGWEYCGQEEFEAEERPLIGKTRHARHRFLVFRRTAPEEGVAKGPKILSAAAPETAAEAAPPLLRPSGPAED
jgi:hypothetical protein